MVYAKYYPYTAYTICGSCSCHRWSGETAALLQQVVLGLLSVHAAEIQYCCAHSRRAYSGFSPFSTPCSEASQVAAGLLPSLVFSGQETAETRHAAAFDGFRTRVHDLNHQAEGIMWVRASIVGTPGKPHNLFTALP